MFKLAREFAKEQMQEAREELESSKAKKVFKAVWVIFVGLVAFVIMIFLQIVAGIGDFIIP